MNRKRQRGVRCAAASLLAAVLVLAGVPVRAANTDPTLALLSASAVRGSSGRATLTLETSFSFDDAIQLSLPIDVIVTQGARVARCGLSGSVSVDGVPQPAGASGVIAVTDRRLTVVLPPEFTTGEATVQLVTDYSRKPIASNVLRFSL